MINPIQIFIHLVFLFIAFVICADDEVRYKAKSYSGGKLENRSFSAKTYKSNSTSLKTRDYTSSTEKTGGFWSFFGKGKKQEYKDLPDQQVQTAKDYRKNENLELEPESLRSKELTGQKEFNGTEVTHGKSYKPTEKKQAHDPLLAPRQGGVKAPSGLDEE